MSDLSQTSARVAGWFTASDATVAAFPSWMAPPDHGPTPAASGPVTLLPSRASTPAVRLSACTPDPALFEPPDTPGFQSASPPAPPPPYPDLREENATLRRQLAQATVALATVRHEVLETSEGELVRLALTIAERIARRELTADPALVVGWVREAMASLGAKDDVVISLAPDLAAAIDPAQWATLSESGARIETDTALASFACEVRHRAASVDASLSGRLDAMKRALRAENE